MNFMPASLCALAQRDAREAPESSPVARVRIARATTQIESVVAFYHEGLGFPVVERFAAHAGYDGVVLALPGTTHLEFTQRAQDVFRPAPGADDLLVVYLPSARQVAGLRRRMERRGHAIVQPLNPYWLDKSVTFEDPDLWRVVLCNAASL
jgi:catechol 2,3-dioxygenase-like lactoylglutathione lyase family enzyme